MTEQNNTQGTPFTAIRLALVYTYPGDTRTPEKEYTVGGFAAETVLQQCTEDSLTAIAAEIEKLSRALFKVAQARGLREEVDEAMCEAGLNRWFTMAPAAVRQAHLTTLDGRDRSSYFKGVESTVRLSRTEKTGRSEVEVPDFELLD